MPDHVYELIEIYEDGIWATDGLLVDGRIIDAEGILGPPMGFWGSETGEAQEYSDQVYELIEAAIADDRESLVHDDILYTWDLSPYEDD